MTVLDRIRDLGVERARSWLVQEVGASVVEEQTASWLTWLGLPTTRLQRVLERGDAGQDLERVVNYVLQHPQAISQTLVLLDHLDEIADTFDLRIGELVLGTDADGTSQLELYVRLRGSLENLYVVRESIDRRLRLQFSDQSLLVVAVVLRRK